MSAEDERELARHRLEALAWAEILRVVETIREGGLAGESAPRLKITLDRFKGGPALVIDEDELAPVTIVGLQGLVGQNLDVELFEGRLVVYCPSWKPDRIPF